MDQVLNSYKKETNSLFAIRQTPSPVKEENGTVRLMWKSQHVPYDGVPFINIGKLKECVDFEAICIFLLVLQDAVMMMFKLALNW